MAEQNRVNARQLCHAALERGKPLDWFEELYESASGSAENIPWADLKANPNLVRWHQRTEFDFTGLRCLKIGCGLGDDCEYLAANGGFVTGFDISATAINWCRDRFPDSIVEYVVADLFRSPTDWVGRFQFVQESYTLQVLPPDLRVDAMERIAAFVAPGGTLLVICRGKGIEDPPGAMPWPLQRSEVETFALHGLTLLGFADFVEDETPPVRRFVAQFQRL